MKRSMWLVFGSLTVLCILLVVADICDITQYVPLSQNYDWLSFIGAIVGGFATCFGVILTIDFQKKNDEEIRRIDNVPMIKIDVSYNSLKEYGGGIFTLNSSEVYTSGFPNDENKKYPIIELRVSNGKPAYDVCIESCATTEQINVVQHAAYAPAKYRLLTGECLKSMFWIQDALEYDSANILGVIRISYTDRFGNKYFQDAAFSYVEGTVDYEVQMEITNPRVPILVDDSAPKLSEQLKDEYPYLFNKAN